MKELAPERHGVSVAYDPARVTPEAMVQAVEQLGYRAALRAPGG